MWDQWSNVSFVNLQMPEWQILSYRIGRDLVPVANVQVEIYLGCYNVLSVFHLNRFQRKVIILSLIIQGSGSLKLSESEVSTDRKSVV